MNHPTPPCSPLRPVLLGSLVALSASLAWAIPLAYEDFSGYTQANAQGLPMLLGQTDARNPFSLEDESWTPNRGWDGQWFLVDATPEGPDAYVEGAPAAYAAQDEGFLNLGSSLRSGAGRLGRSLLEPVMSGVYYTAYTLEIVDGTSIGDTQVWVSRGTSDYPPANAVAGLRNHGGQLAYFATHIGQGIVAGDDPATPAVVETEYLGWLAPEAGNPDQSGGPGEVYITLRDPQGKAVEQTAGTYLYVIKTDLSAKPAKISYYVFAPGADVSAVAKATAKVENLPLGQGRTAGIDALALFGTQSGTRLANLRLAPTYQEAVLLTNGTVVAPQAATPPMLDGLIDAPWAEAPSYTLEKTHNGKVIPDADLKGSFKVLWDADNLYVLVEVADDDIIRFRENVHPEKATDPTGYLNDEFEFFFDSGLERTVGPDWPTAYDINDIQWVFSILEDGSFWGYIQDWKYDADTNVRGDIKDQKPIGWGAGVTVAGKLGEDGRSYVAEVKFPWTALALDGPAGAGRRIGFEMQLNDRDGRDPEELEIDQDNNFIWPSDGKKAFADDANTAWRQSNTFGTLQLVDEIPQDERLPGLVLAFPDATFAGDAATGWYNTQWFGYVYTTAADFPWIYQTEHGWQYVGANSRSNAIYVYDHGAGWLHTTRDLYPHLYAYDLGTWVYYLQGTRGPRWFYDYKSANWLMLP